MFWNKICGFTAIFFVWALNSHAQVVNIRGFSTQKLPHIQFNKPVFKPSNHGIKKDEIFLSRPFAIIPQNYYTQHFGIVCKKEWALEKVTKIPFRFRLGSLQQCNYLEGKR